MDTPIFPAAPTVQLSGCYSPPPLNRVGFRRPQKNSATTPPPTGIASTWHFTRKGPPLYENPGSATATSTTLSVMDLARRMAREQWRSQGGPEGPWPPQTCGKYFFSAINFG